MSIVFIFIVSKKLVFYPVIYSSKDQLFCLSKFFSLFLYVDDSATVTCPQTLFVAIISVRLAGSFLLDPYVSSNWSAVSFSRTI